MFFFYLIMNGIWVSGTWVALGPERKFFDLMITIKHVVYPFFFALGTQRERCSQWNMGFNLTKNT